MALINTGSFAKALWPGINAWYGNAYNDWDEEWSKLFDKYTSDRAFEEDVGVSGFGLAVQKPEGAPISYDSERQGYTQRYQHTTYALGFIITREMMEDDQYDVVGNRKSVSLARSMRITKEIVAASIYNRAFNSTYTGGDGVSLINAAHPLIAGGTFSNQIATASDLSEAALEQAVIDISGFVDDRGIIIKALPKSLVIPYTLQFEAQRILKSVGRVGTDNNDVNALNSMGMFKEVVMSHYFTDLDAWFIRTNVEHGMKYFERRADEFDMDNDFDTENAKYKASGRYSFGWSDPRGIYGSVGA